jgi:hypothetical protein
MEAFIHSCFDLSTTTELCLRNSLPVTTSKMKQLLHFVRLFNAMIHIKYMSRRKRLMITEGVTTSGYFDASSLTDRSKLERRAPNRSVGRPPSNLSDAHEPPAFGQRGPVGLDRESEGADHGSFAAVALFTPDALS